MGYRTKRHSFQNYAARFSLEGMFSNVKWVMSDIQCATQVRIAGPSMHPPEYENCHFGHLPLKVWSGPSALVLVLSGLEWTLFG